MSFNLFPQVNKIFRLKWAVCQIPFVASSKKTFGKSAVNSSFRANTRPIFFNSRKGYL